MKFTIPVKECYIDGESDLFIELPNELIEALDVSEGDEIEWISKEDGSYELRKAT